MQGLIWVNNVIAQKMTFRCTPKANVAVRGDDSFDVSYKQGGSDRINDGHKAFRIGKSGAHLLLSLGAGATRAKYPNRLAKSQKVCLLYEGTIPPFAHKDKKPLQINILVPFFGGHARACLSE